MAKVFPTLETECPVCESGLIVRYDKHTREYTTSAIVVAAAPAQADSQADADGDKGKPATPGEEPGKETEEGPGDETEFGFETS